VAGAARGAWRTLGVCAVLLALAIAYTAGHFAMTTDTGELINPHTPWRQDGAAIEKAFPALKDLILIVVDGQTPELAEDAAQRLTGALEEIKAQGGPVLGGRAPMAAPFSIATGCCLPIWPMCRTPPAS
jgi:hypothetical protein